MVQGNGLNANNLQPLELKHKANQMGGYSVPAVENHALASLTLPKALEPLNPFKGKLAIVQGLSNRIAVGSHSCNFGALGVHSSKAIAQGETIDLALSRALPGVFPHIGLGLTDKPDEGVIYNISASGPNKPAPIQSRPDLAYHGLFGSIAAGTGQNAFKAQTNLLDFLKDDVKRVEKEFTGAERERLQVHLSSLEALRNRQSRLNEIESTLRAKGPVVSNKYTSKVETDRLDAQFDLAAAALICGLSNVVTIASGAGDPYFGLAFTGLGISIGMHGIGHGGSDNGRKWDELILMVRRFHVELIARLAQKLQDVPEGDGTMLDNTCIVFLSDFGESHHPNCKNWPLLLLGNLGGRLKTDGRALYYPAYGTNGHRTLAQLYCTLLHAAGAPRDRFGVADPMLKDLDTKGPLAELLA